MSSFRSWNATSCGITISTVVTQISPKVGFAVFNIVDLILFKDAYDIQRNVILQHLAVLD